MQALETSSELDAALLLEWGRGNVVLLLLVRLLIVVGISHFELDHVTLYRYLRRSIRCSGGRLDCFSLLHIRVRALF